MQGQKLINIINDIIINNKIEKQALFSSKIY